MSTLARLLGDLIARARGKDAPAAQRAGPHDAGPAGALFEQCARLAAGGQIDAACECYERLLRLDPAQAKAHNNLGVLLQGRGDTPAAARSFSEAARIDPGLAEPHVNLGNLHDIEGDPEAAAQCYERAIAIDPGNAQAHCSLAQALLAAGRYERGWQEYEWRWRTGDPRLQLPRFLQPLWDGSQELAGKRVLLHAEQGYGDTIQFIRYATLVAARGAAVAVACDPALARLARTVAGVQGVVATGQALPEFDCHAPLMGLPRAFRTTLDSIPGQVPYVFPDPDATQSWRAALSSHGTALKVGLAWAGRPSFVAAAMKSCPPELIATLTGTPGCTFFSLQKGEAGAALAQGPAQGRAIIDYTDRLGDFSDTAALISALDLVISIDTAVAHLAGALGKPVWLLLAAVPDWRWTPRAGAQRWYPTARLYQQPAPGAWASVIEDVRHALVAAGEAGRAP